MTEKKRVKINEAMLQERFVQYLKQQDALFFSVPNEGHFNSAMGLLKSLKKKGLTSGVPDLIILHEGRMLFLEFKNPSLHGKSESAVLNPKQKIFIKHLRAENFQVFVVADFQEAVEIHRAWHIRGCLNA